MDLCEYNLEDYIKRRKKPISINEIREVLNQLNNVFKILLNENIILRDLKPSNILISLDRLDKCLIKSSNSLLLICFKFFIRFNILNNLIFIYTIIRIFFK